MEGSISLKIKGNMRGFGWAVASPRAVDTDEFHLEMKHVVNVLYFLETIFHCIKQKSTGKLKD